MAVIVAQAPRGPGNAIGVTRPATGAVAGTVYLFKAIMDAADIADPTLTIQMRLFLDARNVYDNSWTCGHTNRAGAFVAPYFTYSCPEDPPVNYRAEVDLPRQVNIGLDITLA